MFFFLKNDHNKCNTFITKIIIIKVKHRNKLTCALNNFVKSLMS